MKHPLIIDSMQVKKAQNENLDDKKENESLNFEIKNKKIYHVNFLDMIITLFLSPFVMMISLYSLSYLVALCVFCIQQYTILFFGGVFVFLMLLFKKMD